MGGGRNSAFLAKETTRIKANMVECRLKQHLVLADSKNFWGMREGGSGLEGQEVRLLN